jgi:hypothetical protein
MAGFAELRKHVWGSGGKAVASFVAWGAILLILATKKVDSARRVVLHMAGCTSV